MEHFEPITPENRWKNDMLEESRKQTELLKQIAQLLQPKEPKEPTQRGKRNARS